MGERDPPAGRDGPAKPDYQRIIDAEPDNLEGLLLVGMKAFRDQRFEDAEGIFRRATKVAPDAIEPWNSLGVTLRKLERPFEAIECFERVVGFQPRDARSYMETGGKLYVDGRVEEAIATFRAAIKLDPAHVGCHLALGHLLKMLGSFDQAVIAFRNCLRLAPNYSEAYWNLANLKTFRFEDAEIAAMEAALEAGRASKDDEVNLCFSLGKAYEDREDFSRSFARYRDGNEKKRALVDYDPDRTVRLTDRLIEVFSAGFLSERADWGCQDASPIFIVGLPRSGSTLIEQILASHSDVEGTSELIELDRIALSTGQDDGQGAAYPDALMDLNGGQIEALGAEYIKSTRARRTGPAHFTDKMPNNFVHVGLLHLILPNAKIIDARRDPVDSCFGSYKQLFAELQGFSYDLDDLANYYLQYDRLMDHWSEVLPGKVLRVDYEDVVADLEGQSRRIVDHCGLDWQDRVLRFWETARAVKSASAEQVRRPIYASSVHSWRNYQDHLGPLIERLEPLL